ncbi:MAG: ArsR/SmtB family transcription factor [Haloplanus sp.]
MTESVPGGAEEGDEGNERLRVLSLTDEDAGGLIGSLASETARTLVTELETAPATASELADEAATSLQNVRHHLGNLRDAGLVRVVGTRYSVKGREMKVYAPADESLVVCVGDDVDRERVRDSLTEKR